jgi:hypothetical protein
MGVRFLCIVTTAKGRKGGEKKNDSKKRAGDRSCDIGWLVAVGGGVVWVNRSNATRNWRGDRPDRDRPVNYAWVCRVVARM